MIVGTPKEIKDHEYRVGLTPAGAYALRQAGHEVVVESGCGTRVGFADAAYADAGATLVASAADVYERVQLVVKVHRPGRHRRDLPSDLALATHVRSRPPLQRFVPKPTTPTWLSVGTQNEIISAGLCRDRSRKRPA